MAKVKNPLFSIEARGGLDGLVYNTWRGISYVKTNTTPANESSANRLIAQARLAAVSALWRDLSDTQRDHWRRFADQHLFPDWTGDDIRLPGFHWFVKLNCQLDRHGSAYIDDPPSAPFPNAIQQCTLSWNDITQDIELTWGSIVGNPIPLDIWITNPMSPGRIPRKEDAHFHLFLADALPQPQPILGLPESLRYGVWVRRVSDTTGLESLWMSDYIDVP